MRSAVLARVDELEHGYAEGAVEEGILRTEDAVSRSLVKDAQLWLSAIFVIVRRSRAKTQAAAELPANSQ